MPLLKVMKGNNEGSMIELSTERVVLGRNADCQVVLNVPAVSREHAIIRKIQGKFILSLDDHPEVRKLFRQWHFLPVDIAYTAQRNTGKRFRELIITNFEPRREPESQATIRSQSLEA